MSVLRFRVHIISQFLLGSNIVFSDDTIKIEFGLKCDYVDIIHTQTEDAISIID